MSIIFALIFAVHAYADCGTGSCSVNSSMNSLDSEAKTIAANLQSNATTTDAVDKVNAWSSKRQECGSSNVGAQKNCQENCNAAMTAANTNNGGNCALSPGGTQGGGVVAASTAGTSLGGATQMQADCGSNQDKCLTACNGSVKAAQDVIKSANATVCPTGTDPESVAKKSTCESLKTQLAAKAKADTSGDQTSASKVSQCNSYDSTMKELAQLINTLGGLLAAANKQSDATAATTPPLDCTATPNNTTCICQADPRSPGCPDFESTVPGSKIFTSAASAVPLNPSNATTGSNDSSGGTGSSSTGAGGSAGSGSGAGGSSGSGGGDAAAAAAPGSKANLEAAQKSALNAKILGEGGGGGGGGGGSGYTYHPPTDAAAKGPAKSAARGIASQYDANISGPGGRSNWDKVKERYKDDRATLNHD